MSRWVRSRGSATSRAGQLDVHARRERVLGDAVVELARDAVPFGVEHLALARGPQLGLRRLQLGVAPGQVVGLAGAPGEQLGRVVEQRAVLQRRRGLTGEDAAGRTGRCRRPPGSGASTRRTPRRPGRRAARGRARAGGAPRRRARRRRRRPRGRRRAGARGPGREPRAGRSTGRRPARARDGEGGSRRARRRRGRTPPSRRTGAPPRPRRRRAPAPRILRSCASARPRSAPVPRSPGAAARRRCGARGSSAACRSAGR